MRTSPPHILSPDLDIKNSGFCARWRVQMDRMQSEMKETIALTKTTIVESRAAMAEADLILARR